MNNKYDQNYSDISDDLDIDISERHSKYYIKRVKILKQRGKINEIPASDRYLVDSLMYSNTPTAICDHSNIGLPPCNNGEGKFCYCKQACESQMQLNNPNRMMHPDLFHKKETELLEKSRNMSMEDPDDLPDEYYEELIKNILG